MGFVIDELKKIKWHKSNQYEIGTKDVWDEHYRVCIIDEKEKKICFDMENSGRNDYIKVVVKDLYHDYSEVKFDYFRRK